MDFLLNESLKNRQPIKIFYMDKHEKISERIVRIEYVNEKYIRAYCYWRKGIRVFTKANLLSIGHIKRKAGA